MADLTHLDGAALKRFLDNDLDDFVEALKAIRKDSTADSGGVRALKSIVDGRTTPDTLQQSQALTIGTLGTDDSTHGKTLLTAVTDAAGTVDTVFGSQQNLFGDISRDLKQTITTLLDAQGSSLHSIGAEQLLDVFSDVGDDLSEDTGSNSTSQHGS